MRRVLRESVVEDSVATGICTLRRRFRPIVNPMQRLPVLTQLQKLNHKENQTSLMARAGFLLVRLSMHPSGSDNQSTNPMRGNNMNPMQGNEGSMSNEMGTRGRPSVGRFPTAWSLVELLPGALIRGVKSLSSHRAHFGPFASLLSAGVSLFGCSQQSNANIRLLRLLFIVTFRLWTTYSCVLNSH
jgi:hypothetical protein